MSERYRVEILFTQIFEIVANADSPEEASECALQGEGEPGDSWHEEPTVSRVVKLT